MNDIRKLMNIMEAIQSPNDWSKLARLLYAPEEKITPSEMRRRIYNLYSDEQLFDFLDNLESENPDVDAGPYVMDWFEKNRESDYNKIWQKGKAGKLLGEVSEEETNELTAEDIESIYALVLEEIEDQIQTLSDLPSVQFDEYDHVEEAVESIKEYTDKMLTPARPTDAGLAVLDEFVRMIVDEKIEFDFDDPESVAEEINTTLEYDRMDVMEQEKKLRKVRVKFDDGNVINTSMAARLTDEEILDYYAIGKEFNIGDGEHDKMASVVDVEILEAAPLVGLAARGLAAAAKGVGSVAKSSATAARTAFGSTAANRLADKYLDNDLDGYLEVEEADRGQHNIHDVDEWHRNRAANIYARQTNEYDITDSIYNRFDEIGEKLEYRLTSGLPVDEALKDMLASDEITHAEARAFQIALGLISSDTAIDEADFNNGYGDHHVADDEEINGFPPRAHSSSVKNRKFGHRGDNILDEDMERLEKMYKRFLKN